MYYDRKRGFWDDYACQRNPGGRCVKMDCHEPDTHFSLLGFFKEPAYDTWMEQLFKHEGDCVWSDNEYKFMQQNRENWPTKCTQSMSTDDNGNYLYYDTKPGEWGTMFIGLYSDSKCTEEYTGATTAEEVLKLMSAGGDDEDVVSLEEQLATWNKAFNVFKYCQPCKAYDLVDIVAGSDAERNSTGTRYQNYNNGKDNGGDDGFYCADAAGYTDVNQCMKFKTKTTMLTATFNDLLLAEMQGTVTGFSIKSDVGLKSKTFKAGFSPNEKKKVEQAKTSDPILWYSLFLSSVIVFGISLHHYRKVNANNSFFAMKEPLVAVKKAFGVMV